MPIAHAITNARHACNDQLDLFVCGHVCVQKSPDNVDAMVTKLLTHDDTEELLDWTIGFFQRVKGHSHQARKSFVHCSCAGRWAETAVRVNGAASQQAVAVMLFHSMLFSGLGMDQHLHCVPF